MNKYWQSKLPCSFDKVLVIIMISMVNSQPYNRINYLLKGVTPPFLATFSFLKYKTNGVTVLKQFLQNKMQLMSKILSHYLLMSGVLTLIAKTVSNDQILLYCHGNYYELSPNLVYSKALFLLVWDSILGDVSSPGPQTISIVKLIN